MEKKKSTNNQGFPVWIIYVVLVLLIVAIPLAKDLTGPQKIENHQFYKFLKEGDIKKIVTVREDNYNYVEIYLTEKALEKASHKEIKEKKKRKRTLCF